MIFSSDKIKPDSFSGESENLTAKKKSRPSSKTESNGCKNKTETCYQIPPDLNPDMSVKNKFQKTFDDPQLRLKLLQLTPRNPAKETSEGVQEFIKHVSSFIDKKNPFKDKVFGMIEKKTAGGMSGVGYKKEQPKKSNLVRNVGFSNKKKEDTKSIDSGRVNVTKSSETKKKTKSTNEETNGRNQTAHSKFNNQKSPESSSEGEPADNHPQTPVVKKVREKVIEVSHTEQRKVRPSEIPLRKDRVDFRKKMQVSLLMKKKLHSVESVRCVTCYQDKKPFTPIEEGNLEAAVESNEIHENTTLEAIVKIDDALEISSEEKCEEPMVNAGTKLDNLSEHSNCEEKQTLSKGKKLDLEKVKSSSFTVLKTRTDTLHRLESLHRQNVSGKENAFIEKNTSNSSKLKLLTPKSSFNSLKGKCSKKNLASRSSSKGNKPVLKSKAKKNKVEQKEAPPLPKLKPKPKQGCEIRKENTVTKSTIESVKTEVISEETVKSFTSDNPIPRKPVTAGPLTTIVTLPEVDAITRKSLPEFLISKHTISNEICSEKNIEQVPMPPPPTPEEKCLINEIKIEKSSEVLNIVPETKCNRKPKKKSKSPIKDIQLRELVVKGKSINLKNKHDATDKIKLDIKIEINAQEDPPEQLAKPTPKFDWLFLNNQNDPQNKRSGSSNSTECDTLRDEKDASVVSEADSRKTSRSSSSLTKPLKPKASSTSLKVSKKVRPDARDRWLLTSDGRFNSPVSFQNKIKPDLKLRSGLTKSYNREVKSSEKKTTPEDNAAIGLRRRNSEPHSFRGFIWKRGDAATLKSNRASISSMTSSLRHLNTDELEDFIFWEAIPQRMTSCWEMSLYHFKRPWSVLSCSIFQDNRRSNTPGQILEKLRNGGSVNRQRLVRETEGIVPKEDIFDVEPSIAQKNMDIKNWLAALNFSTSPSTSADVINEGNFCTQASMEGPTKNQATPKRRKVLPGLRFSDKTFAKKPDDKKRFKSSRKWHPDDVGDLMELIRRKSGGFVTTEQFLNPDIPTRPQNVTINFCTYPESISEDLVVRKMKHSNHKRPAKAANSSEVSTCNPEETADVTEEPKMVSSEGETIRNPHSSWGRMLKGNFGSASNVNVWKYLFFFTILFIAIYHFFLVEGGPKL